VQITGVCLQVYPEGGEIKCQIKVIREFR